MNNTPFAGLYYLIEGYRLIFQPGLKRFIIAPLVINLALFIGLFFVAYHYSGAFNAWLAHLLPTWLQWLQAIVWLIFFIGFLLTLLYTFVTLANLIAAPFNSVLAQKVESYLLKTSPNKEHPFSLLKEIPRSLTRQLATIGYYLPRAALLLILFFIPIIQIVAPFIWLLFHAWFITLQYIDYPADNDHVSFNDTRLWLQQVRWSALGFGTSALTLAMIPLLNCVMMPAAVAGATLFWIENNQKRK